MRNIMFLLIVYLFFARGAIAQTVTVAADVPVITGGVGVESSEALRPQQSNFNLKFVFTFLEGDYIADVNVKLADAGGRVVLEILVEGPILMARLPAGNYVATLTYEGVTQTRKLVLRDKSLRTEQLRWKRSAADGAPML